MKMKFPGGVAAMIVASFASLFVAGPAAADDYPSRPITIICPYTPGDGPDVIARLIGAELSQRLGKPVIIENRAGASGQIGMGMTAKAPPDGYTLGVGLVTNLSLAKHAYKALPYDPLKDLTPVALATINYLAMVARPDSPFKTVTEMIAWAKANPGKLKVGTTSLGGLPHMSFEQLAYMTGIQFTNIPYKGNGAIVADLIGGRLDLTITSYTSLAAQIESGQLHLLGITYGHRDPKLPNLPTIGESVPGYESDGWFGFLAPAGTPKPIVDKLNAEINRALKQPKMLQTLSALGLIPVTESPEYFGQLMQREDQKFAKLVKDIGYQPQ